MAEPIAALIVRILADTSEMVTGVKNVAGQLDTLENRVAKFGKAIAGYFTVQAIAGFTKELIADAEEIDRGAKRIGADAQEFQKFSYALKQTSGDAADAAQSIAVLNEKVGSNDPGLLSVLRKLNIEAAELAAQDPIERYVRLGIAINDIADPARRAALAYEALGAKGEKALSGITREFRETAARAATYTDEELADLKRLGDGFDNLWMRIKVGAAGAALAIKDVLTKGVDVEAELKKEMSDNKTPGKLPVVKGKPGWLPSGAAPAMDPGDVNALALAFADLSLDYTRVSNAAEEADAEWKRQIDILKMLNVGTPSVTEAIGKLMDKMGTTTKVDNFAQRISAAATSLTALRRETDAMLASMNPANQTAVGESATDRIGALQRGIGEHLDAISANPLNWVNGELTPQAFQDQLDLLDRMNIETLKIQSGWQGVSTALASVLNVSKDVANVYDAIRAPSMIGSAPHALMPALLPNLGSEGVGLTDRMSAYPNPSGFASVMNPSITINAQGSFWDSPDQMNRLGRIIEDALGRRLSVSHQVTRR